MQKIIVFMSNINFVLSLVACMKALKALKALKVNVRRKIFQIYIYIYIIER